jgi:hypothetical protein
VAGIGVALAAVGAAGEASAGVWRWGCTGPLGDNQILFTRYHLIVVPAQPSRGKLEDIIFLDDLAKDASDVEQYMATDIIQASRRQWNSPSATARTRSR